MIEEVLKQADEALLIKMFSGSEFSFDEGRSGNIHENYYDASVPFCRNMLFLWRLSYEFDDNDNWDVIEEFAEFMGRCDDIWYATNIEVYDYVHAYKNL